MMNLKKLLRSVFVLTLTAVRLEATELPPNSSKVEAHVLRLAPGEDPKLVLEKYVREKNLQAASIASAVGSLTTAVLRYANEDTFVKLEGHREIVSLSGTISTSNTHLHMSVSDNKGVTVGGHLGEGSKVYTTVEIVLLSYPDIQFVKKKDPTFGYDELSVIKKN